MGKNLKNVASLVESSFRCKILIIMRRNCLNKPGLIKSLAISITKWKSLILASMYSHRESLKFQPCGNHCKFYLWTSNILSLKVYSYCGKAEQTLLRYSNHSLPFSNYFWHNGFGDIHLSSGGMDAFCLNF